MSRQRAAPRALGLTATIEAEVNAVRLEIDLPAGHNMLGVGRTGPSGAFAYVRGYAEVPTADGVNIVRDFEAPLGVPLRYDAWSWDTAVGAVETASVTVTIPDGGCDDTWLTDLARPLNTQRLTVVALPELAYNVAVGVHDVLGRRTPITSSDIANTPTFELQLLTENDAAREQARSTLGNGVPVLLRTPPANGIGSLYLAVLGWRERRIVAVAREDDRVFAVAAVQVTRPDPGLYVPIPPATYELVAVNYADYAELMAERVNYDAVLYDYAGAEAADAVPWPPTDV